MRFYSPSNGCTYLKGVHSDFPADCVVIDEQTFLQVVANPAAGKVRSHDQSGQPILIDPPAQSLPEQLSAVHARQQGYINESCENTITGGFWSSALGERHQYGSQLQDQLNLTSVVLAGQDTLYACRDESGVKEFRAHSFAQISQVGDDFISFRQAQLQKANDLKQQLNRALAAGDMAALEAVTWEGAQS